MANVTIPSARTHITLEYTGDQPLKLPKVGRQQFTLKPGDNEIPMPYFHAVGHSLEPHFTAGAIKRAHRTHVFLQAQEGIDDDGDVCRSCGHSRASAAASAAEDAS